MKKSKRPTLVYLLFGFLAACILLISGCGDQREDSADEESQRSADEASSETAGQPSASDRGIDGSSAPDPGMATADASADASAETLASTDVSPDAATPEESAEASRDGDREVQQPQQASGLEQETGQELPEETREQPTAETTEQPGEASTEGGTKTGDEPSSMIELLQNAYRDVQTFEADFEQTYRNRLLDRTRESKGHVWLRPPSKMRWEYEPPTKNLIVADGTTLFMFEPEPNQVVKMPVAGSELPSVMAFLTGGKNITNDYHVQEVHQDKLAPQGLAGLELRPRQPSSVVARVVLVISRVTGRVQKTVLVEPESNTNTFTWSHVKTNVSIPLHRFTFTPPAGARILER